MKLIKAQELNFSNFPKLHPLYSSFRNAGGKKRNYNREVCAFDIETTTIKEINQAVMYIWQFAIEDLVIVGRTWEEFKKFVSMLKVASMGRTTIIFVHNLSYEIQWLSGIFHFENENIFPTEPRHVLKANLDNLEFRCSYRLTNLSLDALTARYKVEHGKQHGFDYSKTRYPWTELSDQELKYCVNDVLGLVECIHAIMELNGDDLYTLPLTSTGFVRRECKRAMKEQHAQIIKAYPDYEVFKLLRREFRGGNTHANRYYTDEVIKQTVHNKDISSSYPAQQCTKLFPVTAFEPIKGISCAIIDTLIQHGFAVLFEVTLKDIHLRDKYIPVPYIPTAKTRFYKDISEDNGRILSAKELTMVVNEIDWKIIIKQYTFTAIPTYGYKAKLGKLPQGLIDCNIKFFKDKTELKGVQGQELFYLKSKELLNSIYGMSVQNPAKGSILFDDCLYQDDESKTEEELLLKAKRKAFTLYQFGCWTTAHARDALQHGIDLCGDDLLYCDTDSCKYLGEHDFTQYNAERKAAAIEAGLFATDKHGVTHYGGIYETEDDYRCFRTMSAKKYAYTDKNGLHVTVSGVGKKLGAESLVFNSWYKPLEYTGLESFEDGYIFHNCGKTRAIFNDGNYGDYFIDGHKINITRNMVIEDQDYTLNRTREYKELVEESKYYLWKVMKSLDTF